MKRVLVLCVGLTLLPSASAFGVGMNLYWNDCWVGGVTNKAFACNTNAGVSVLVASFDPPPGITQLVAGRAVIDLATASTPLPSWWHLEPGGCRDGSLSLSFAPASTNCTDYWSAAATGGFTYAAGFGGDLNNARIVVSWSIPEAMAGPVLAGTEYYAFSLMMDNLMSAGTEACAGCNVPTCIVLREITLYQAPGLGDYRICDVYASNFITWQGGAIGSPGCPGGHDPPAPCSTPVLNRTWGQVKGLYR